MKGAPRAAQSYTFEEMVNHTNGSAISERLEVGKEEKTSNLKHLYSWKLNQDSSW